MSKFKVVDRDSKKVLGVANVDFAKLSNLIKTRIVSGVCLVLMISSTFAVSYEAIDSMKHRHDKLENNAAYYETVEMNNDIAFIRNENIEDIKEDIDARIEYLEENFQKYEELSSLSPRFVSIKASEDLFEYMRGNFISYSEMVLVRDELREICDGVKDLLEKMNRDNKKKEEDILLPNDDRNIFPVGDGPRDIFYKESLNTGRRL